MDKPFGNHHNHAEILKSSILSSAGFSHGFFTRRGGVSPHPWDSLNFAISTGDTLENIAINLERAGAALGIDPAHIYFLSQVHGTHAVFVDKNQSRTEIVRREGDIVVSACANVGCGVRGADCAPVLIADCTNGTVCAVHSGWRGTVQNAVSHAIQLLTSQSKQSPSLVAAIGPHIERCCFEVGSDVAEHLVKCSPLGQRAIFFSSPAIHVDLRAILRSQLIAFGVSNSNIDDVFGCTMCDKDRFFSFRRDGKISGRLLSVIVSHE